MRISTHEMFPLFEDGKVVKFNAMQQAVGGFDRHKPETLEEVQALLTDDNCVYAPIYWRTNHRLIENAMLNKVDIIMFDSDDGDSAEQIQEMFQGVEFLLLRTAGWSKQLEKYRIIVPLDTPMGFENADEYTHFMRWLGELIGLNFDESTTECGRGYIGLKGAVGVIQQGIKLDPSASWDIELDNYYKAQELEEKKRQRAQLRYNIKQNNSKFKSQKLEPKHLINKPKYKEYFNNIYQGNYSTGIIAIMGYFKKCGCDKNDVREWLIGQNFGTADAKYIDQKIKMW